MKKVISTIAFALTVLVSIAQNTQNYVYLEPSNIEGNAQYTISSPDSNMQLIVSSPEGMPQYSVSYNGKMIIQPSALGLLTNIGDFSSGLTLADKAIAKSIADDYSIKNIKKSNVRYEANALTINFSKNGKTCLGVEFRISNTDVAFCYTLYPDNDTRVAVISGEATSFNLPNGTTTFLCPQAQPMVGFARTSPSYETHYIADDDMGKNGWGQGYTFPCLFRENTDGWLLISETGTHGNYVGCRLVNEHDGIYRIGFPQEGEMNGMGSTSVAVSLPATTPWRTITYGTTLAPIVETTIPFDVISQQYEASQEYTYGKGTWSWIMGMDPSCNFSEQQRYIDFAADMGYQSVLVDALWDTQIGYDKIAELSRYAKNKNVGLFLWYNSNGTWNDAPQTPIEIGRAHV